MNPDLELGTQKMSDIVFRVGDIITIDDKETLAYVVQSEIDHVQAVDEYGRLNILKKAQCKIDKKSA